MKTRLLIIIGMIVFPLLIPQGFADCDVNSDWLDAPCMDQIINNKFPQHQVNKWAEYFDYKGEQFMDLKRVEMNDAISNNNLLEWIDQSIQNQNVWQYYYFTGQAPNPFPHFQNVTFELNEPVLTKKILSGAIIDCIAGYKQVGTECMPDDSLTLSYGHQWIVKIILIILVLIAIVVGIVIGIKVWRKRK